MDEKGNIIIYLSEDGEVRLDVRLEDQTVWLTQQQMADLFGSSRTNVLEHIKHIYEDDELNEEATISNFEIYMRHYMVILRFAQTQAERVLCFIFNI